MYVEGSDLIPLFYDEREEGQNQFYWSVGEAASLYSPTGMVDLARNPSYENFVRAAFGPAFFTAVGIGSTYIFGAPGQTIAQRYTIQSLASWHARGQLARGVLVGGARAAAIALPVAIVLGSAYAQYQIGQSLGAGSSVSMKYSRSNSGSGGSMPVVTSQDTSDPTGGLRDDLRQMFGLD